MVKVLNPDQKSKFVTKIWHNIREKFHSPEALKERLVKSFEDKLPSASSVDIGYFEKRGSAKRWIEDQDDLDAMYQAFAVGDEIILWIHGVPSEHATKKSGKNRKRDEEQESSSLSSRRAEKESQIDSVFQQLQELHHDQYSGPQLRLWARMKVNGQHDSIDSPPRIPLFSGLTPNRPAKSNSLNEALTSAATAVVSMLKGTSDPSPQKSITTSESMSPAKRAHISGTYLDHLDKLKKLLESGVLSQEEFEEQKRYVLANLRSLHC